MNSFRINTSSGIFLQTAMLYLIFFVSSCTKIDDVSKQKIADADSVRLLTIQEEYRKALTTDYEESRKYLYALLDEVDRLPAEKSYLANYFLSYSIAGELDVGNYHLFDSITRTVFDSVFHFGYTKLYSIVHENRGLFFWKTQQFDSASVHFQASIRYAEHLGKTEPLIVNKLNMTALLSGRVDNDSLIGLYEEIIDLCIDQDYPVLLSIAYNNLATLYVDIGQLYNGLSCYQKSIEGFKALGEDITLLQVSSNIAGVYSDLGMDSLAIGYYFNVIQMAKKFYNYQALTVALSNLAYQYLNMGQEQVGIDTLESLVDSYHKGVFPIDEMYLDVLINLGSSYIGCEQYPKAKDLLFKAYNIASEDGLNIERVRAAMNLSTLYNITGNADSSFLLCHDNLDIAMQQQMTKEVYNLALLKANYYRAKGLDDMAYKMYDIYVENITKYYDTVTNKKVKDIAYFYELQQKEDDQKLLKKENDLHQISLQAEKAKNKQQSSVILFAIVLIVLLIVLVLLVRNELEKKQKINRMLEEENVFKNSLFSIMSHDVRSPIINMYNSFLLLKSDKVSPENKQRIETELVDRSAKTIGLIDNILYWTRKQFKGENDNVEKVSLKQLIDEVYECDLATNIIQKVSFHNLVSSSTTLMADKGLVRLLIRNLLSNAFKYTNKSGMVSVAFDEDEKKYIVKVADTGIGLSEEQQKKLFNYDDVVSVRGIHNEQGKGIGLSLCKYFLTKQGGNIWFESTLGKGTTFYFSLPKFQ